MNMTWHRVLAARGQPSSGGRGCSQASQQLDRYNPKMGCASVPGCPHATHVVLMQSLGRVQVWVPPSRNPTLAAKAGPQAKPSQTCAPEPPACVQPGVLFCGAACQAAGADSCGVDPPCRIRVSNCHVGVAWQCAEAVLQAGACGQAAGQMRMCTRDQAVPRLLHQGESGNMPSDKQGMEARCGGAAPAVLQLRSTSLPLVHCAEDGELGQVDVPAPPCLLSGHFNASSPMGPPLPLRPHQHALDVRPVQPPMPLSLNCRPGVRPALPPVPVTLCAC